DGGRTWEAPIRIDTDPYSGGYGMRGAAQLPDGDILLPLSDVPNYRVVFVVRSADGGRSWSPPLEVAQVPGKEFEEPTIQLFPDGRILLLLRENISRRLHQCESLDGGLTWSAPAMTSITGYPGHLLALPDGRLVCVVGYRYAPFGIRAVISGDNGHTWDTENALVLREDLPNKDLGYPSSILTADGHIFTVYYGQDSEGVNCIQATRWLSL